MAQSFSFSQRVEPVLQNKLSCRSGIVYFTGLAYIRR